MRTVGRAQVWQDRFDGLVLVAAGLAVAGVALQVAHLSRATDALGFVISWGAWLILAINALVMLRVVPDRSEWAWSHAFELIVLVVAFPAWALLLPQLAVLELSPAVTVLEAAKLAKLAEAVRIVRRHKKIGATRGVVVAVVVVLALGAGGLMLRS